MTENKKTVVTDENKEEAKIIDGQEASTSGEDSPPGCPICAFIEAGDCKLQHQVTLRWLISTVMDERLRATWSHTWQNTRICTLTHANIVTTYGLSSVSLNPLMSRSGLHAESRRKRMASIMLTHVMIRYNTKYSLRNNIAFLLHAVEAWQGKACVFNHCFSSRCSSSAPWIIRITMTLSCRCFLGTKNHPKRNRGILWPQHRSITCFVGKEVVP